MGVLEAVVWLYGITWAGIILGIAVSKNTRKEDDGQ